MDLAGELPGHGAEVDGAQDKLGARDIDRSYDWGVHVGKYPSLTSEFWKDLKASDPATEIARSSASPETLVWKQRLLYESFVSHYGVILCEESPPQFLINLDGKAGTGKSHVIMLISATLQDMAEERGRPCPIIRSAPTGVAAHGISGPYVTLPVSPAHWKGRAAISHASGSAGPPGNFQGDP
ncbi:hypothetical protein VTN31DRAFT_5590 [Thermomyces dupontii]